jgi:hypothetical protein
VSEAEVRPDLGGWISGPCLSRPLNPAHGMSGEDSTALFYLRRLWRDRYQVTYSAGVWRAGRLGTFGRLTLEADCAEKLRNVIGEDYRVWQIEARRRA